MPFRLRLLLAAFYLVASFWALWLGYDGLPFMMLFCFLGGVSAWRLWKHYRRRELQAEFKTDRWVFVLSALSLLLLPLLPYIFDWLGAN